MIGFWGPNMSALLEECERRGIHWRDEPISAFREDMNERTGLSITEDALPEDAAAAWLGAWADVG